MKLQEKQKKQAGITLVALVVTIIILIILATISIRMVIGEGGLIWQANNGKVEYRAAEVEEEVLAWKTEKKLAKYADEIQPKNRDAFIDDQLARGLLTPEEAEDAKDDGKVKIGSRVIDYGEDGGIPNIPDGGDGQDSEEGAIKYTNFNWPSIGKAEVTVNKNTENKYSMEYQVYKNVETEEPTKEWTEIESGAVITDLELGNVVKTAFTDGKGHYGETADFTVTDTIKPESTASFTSTTTNTDGSVTVTVKLIDNQSGIDLNKCKWVYNTDDKDILDDESYTETFTEEKTEDIELTLKTEIVGTYYLHILSVDKAGNKTEAKYGPIEVEEPKYLWNYGYGEPRNSEYYGYKVADYNTGVDQVGCWRLFYQDDAYTYLISHNVIDKSIKLGSNLTDSYKTDETVSIGSYLNPFLASYSKSELFYYDSIWNSIYYLCDPNNVLWSGLANDDCEWSIGAPSIELFIASWNATTKDPDEKCARWSRDNMIPYAGNNHQWVPGGSYHTGDATCLDYLYYGWFYPGENYSYWLCSCFKKRYLPRISISSMYIDGDENLPSLGYIDTTDPYGSKYRPIVCMKTEKFNESYFDSLINE